MERIKNFLKSFGRGANEPDQCVILHLNKVGNAGSGGMQRERLFTSMKVRCGAFPPLCGNIWGRTEKGGFKATVQQINKC